jgi:hypothetical protein
VALPPPKTFARYRAVAADNGSTRSLLSFRGTKLMNSCANPPGRDRPRCRAVDARRALLLADSELPPGHAQSWLLLCRAQTRAQTPMLQTIGTDDEQQPSPRLDVMLALNAKQQPADDSPAATGDRVAIAHASPRMPGFSRLCHPDVMGVHAVAMPHLGARRRAERSPDPAAAINVQLGQFCVRIGW